MEFLDDDARPRFLFQSQSKASSVPESQAYQKPSKPFLFFAISLSSLFFALSIFYLQSEPFRSLLIWLSLSLLIGPFAPNSLTGGDIRVGHGSIVEFPDEEPAVDEDTNKRSSQKRSKTRRSEDIAVGPIASIDNVNVSERAEKKNQASGAGGNGVVLKEEKEWTEEDVEILKKQMSKHPVGKPRRWEVIAEAFSGRHRTESVIKKAKELGEKKLDDTDSYTQFLKKRKPVDKRLENGNEHFGGESEEKAVNGTGEGSGSGWSSGEDIALLNALKAFPKDVAMRWEKIAAAVPGKSKAACVKRVSELKKEFRSAKAAADA
ncbi:transcription factor MAMYB [Prosopis cineraria]|uniref:transcription factor MAMYB n=1 Tax=Prosopis cineraria TaxID=364024 RepID=UPI00240EC523|nr:transcription factor MAMYB [Prosopis cineraria]